VERNSSDAAALALAAPIVQGPFGGGLSAVDLVVAVNEGGGLGSFGAHNLDGAGIRMVAAEIRARSSRAFALNLWIPLGDSDDPQLSDEAWRAECDLLRPYFEELRCYRCQRGRRALVRDSMNRWRQCWRSNRQFSVSCFGVPTASVLDRCRSAGIVTVGTATTAAEAKLLDNAGVDAIVATGFEAGGHRVSFLGEPEDCLTGTLALVPQVVDAVRVPVIAAGGIADGRGIAAALRLGASAVQIGTAFLACEESNAPPLHREKLFSADARRTTLTRAFTGRLARSIHSGFIDAMHARHPDYPPYPVHSWFMAHLRGAALRCRAYGHELLVVGTGCAAAQVPPCPRTVGIPGCRYRARDHARAERHRGGRRVRPGSAGALSRSG
jgi:nitronate monooxygenase